MSPHSLIHIWWRPCSSYPFHLRPLSSQLSSFQPEENSSFLNFSSCCNRLSVLSILNISVTFPGVFFGYMYFLSCIKQPNNSWRSWTTSLNRTKDVFHVAFSIFLLSILWTFFFITNTLFLYPEIMTTLDSIFSSLQRGSIKQTARLCHDQLKQLILSRQEPNYSL